MEIKAENPLHLLEEKDLNPILLAYFEFNHLKNLYRQGWLRRGVPPERCESVAEHSLGVAILAIWLAEKYHPELDLCKLLQMALIHDFGEIYAGDIIPQDVVSQTEKYHLELDSVQQVFSRLQDGDRYISLWCEFEAGESPEATFLRQVDRLEMALQAAVYKGQGYQNLGEFFDSAENALTDPDLQKMMSETREIQISSVDQEG